MAHSWLQRQRKQTILDLSKEAGLKQDEDLKKDELIETLHSHLQANASRLSRNSAFESYYGPRSSTPYKSGEKIVDAISDEVKSVVKGKGRKPTKAKQESDDIDALTPKAIANAASTAAAKTSTTLTQATQAVTPALKRVRQSIPGPPSPSVIADAVEQASNKYLGGVNKYYAKSGVPEHLSSVRGALSSVTSVQLTVLLIEAFAVQRVALSSRYAFDTPAVPLLGISSVAVSLPDIFSVLTPNYWSATLTWTATGIILPAIIAYFFNLSVRDVKRGGARVAAPRYTTDPLSFNIAKALITWLVYSKFVGEGRLWSLKTVTGVRSAFYGDLTGMFVGSGIVALAALYDAAQGK